MMPQIGGLEVCRRMKKLAAETDVIILTAYDGEQLENAAFDAGASAVVAKHAASDALCRQIQRLAERKALRTVAG
jgi:CheY-like chemotaxis protein